MQRFVEHEDPATGQRYLEVRRHGFELKNDPLLNKGTCFTAEERAAFGLTGLMPPAVSTPEAQEARAYGSYRRAADDVARYLFLVALQDRNETLFYRLLTRYLEEMAPIVYTPTVGKACEQYSRIFRRPRGVYLTAADAGHFAEILRRAPVEDCRVIVVTDNEAILGLGDLGVGGMAIPIGKLALYTAGAGIHPASCLPVDLDVGTDNQALLRDPLYLGARHPRLRGERYLALLDELVEAVREVFPGALLQWEDFANENAFQVLARYRERVLSFDDDIQGTGAVVVAAIESALRQLGQTWQGQRVAIFGAGASGGGCARAIGAAMRAAGVPDSTQAVLCLDSQGLILRDRPGLTGHKVELAVERAVVERWPGARGDRIGLLEVVRAARPTVLVGASGQPGAFSPEIVRALRDGCRTPIVLPLSNPTERAEAAPADILRWTENQALVATGSPFPPVELDGRRLTVSQANNALVFPGVGLGAVAVGARTLPDAAFLVAAQALAATRACFALQPGQLLPPLGQLRPVSRAVGLAVARWLVVAGQAPPLDEGEIEARIARLIWEPRYLPYRPPPE